MTKPKHPGLTIMVVVLFVLTVFFAVLTGKYQRQVQVLAHDKDSIMQRFAYYSSCNVEEERVTLEEIANWFCNTHDYDKAVKWELTKASHLWEVSDINDRLPNIDNRYVVCANETKIVETQRERFPKLSQTPELAPVSIEVTNPQTSYCPEGQKFSATNEGTNRIVIRCT